MRKYVRYGVLERLVRVRRALLAVLPVKHPRSLLIELLQLSVCLVVQERRDVRQNAVNLFSNKIVIPCT